MVRESATVFVESSWPCARLVHPRRRRLLLSHQFQPLGWLPRALQLDPPRWTRAARSPRPLARDPIARLSWIHQEDRAPWKDHTADGLHQRGDEIEWEELQAAVAMGCGASAASGKVPRPRLRWCNRLGGTEASQRQQNQWERRRQGR